MVFLRYNEEGKIIYKNNYPFHEKYGLGKTKEELEKEGILVNSIPQAEDIEGKYAELYVDLKTKELYCKYFDVEPKDEVQQEIETLKQSIAELTAVVTMLLTPTE